MVRKNLPVEIHGKFVLLFSSHGAEKVKGELGIKPIHREVEKAGATYALRESSEAYGREFAQKVRC
jgi:hypothetical protein